MAKWTYEATKAGYGNLWRSIRIKSGDLAGASKYARIIIASESRYRGVTAKTGVPWYFIGALHMRESGCDFGGVLHNGEHIIGKNRKTRLVPAGRGPFSSWEEAAVDALKIKGLHKINDWCPERMGFHGELFNGLGYVGKGVNSAYLWAGSNHEQLGKYVADHKWDKSFDDPQIGVMTVLKRLCELRPDISAAMSDKFVPPPPDVEPTPKKETKPAVKSKTVWAQIIAALTAVGGVLTDWRVATVLVIGAIAAFVIWQRVTKTDISGWFK